MTECSEIKTQHFYDLRHQTIFNAIEKLSQARKPIDLISLQQQLKSRNQVESVGGLGYLSSLSDTVPSANNIRYYLDILIEKYRLRKIVQTCTEIPRRVSDYEGPVEDLLIAVTSDLARLSDECGQSKKVASAELLEERRFRFDVVPPQLNRVYTLAGHCIATPGNLATITSAAKTGKSAVLGAMAASAMPHGDNADLLGFNSSNPKGLALLWFDSEQSKDDHWHCVNRALRRAGLQKPPLWFTSHYLTGIPFRRAWETVLDAVRLAADAHAGIHSIFLDGAADFVADVNDAAECNAFVATLHGIAIEHTCPIVSVIHFNPGSDKSRGHLGSQLERKAETNLRLDKVNGVTVIWSDKQRRAPIPKDSGPCPTPFLSPSNAASRHACYG